MTESLLIYLVESYYCEILVLSYSALSVAKKRQPEDEQLCSAVHSQIHMQ